MAVVRKTSCEWWSIVESVELSALRELDLYQMSVCVRMRLRGIAAYLSLKGLDLLPSGQDGLLFLWEIDRHGVVVIYNFFLRRGCG